MNEVARTALLKLLSSEENARSKLEPGRAVTLRLSAASFPQYQRFPTASEKADCNAALRLAEKEGAIAIEWDVHAESMTHAERLLLVDGDKLADFLAVEPRWRVVESAEQALVHIVSRRPVLKEVLDCWRRGMTARGTRAQDVASWVDADAVLSHCEATPELDIPVRRLSSHLFRSSKRIEALYPLLDVLQSEALTGLPPRDAEEVLTALGLLKFPPTLLLALAGHLQVEDQTAVALRPYSGIPPDSLRSVVLAPAVTTLLSIENLTTFHEMALNRHAHSEVALVYTAGMPSPSWLRAYRVLLDALPSGARVLHWGDIDAGGFRIAAHIAKTCAAAGWRLALHAMAPSSTEEPCGDDECSLDGQEQEQLKLTPAELRQIQRICDARGWDEEAAAVIKYPRPVEQEALPLLWPSAQPLPPPQPSGRHQSRGV